jgi:hypothetical protein
MSFTNVQSQPNFKIAKSNRVDTAFQDSVDTNGSLVQQIIFATFERVNNEFKINPINLNDAGYFTVSQLGFPTLTIHFYCSSEYKRVVGMISYERGYQLSQPSPDEFVFTLLQADQLPLFGSLSLMVTK